METKEIKTYLQNLFVQLDFEPCTMPFDEYMLQWLESVKNEIAPSTYTGYRQCVNIICEYFFAGTYHDGLLIAGRYPAIL